MFWKLHAQMGTGLCCICLTFMETITFVDLAEIKTKQQSCCCCTHRNKSKFVAGCDIDILISMCMCV